MIAGAGTGGLALAHALKRAGFPVQVFERNVVPAEDQGGYRVGISPAGSRALKSCVPPDVYDLFVSTCARPQRYMNIFTERFSELICLELQGEAVDPVDSEQNVVRKTLRRVLLTGLEEEVSFGKRFDAYTQNGDGSVTAHFVDGTSATADILVGADGAGSKVRKQRLPHARHEETGIVSVGGQVPRTPETAALFTEKMLRGMSMLMAPHGFGAIIHSLEFSDKRAMSNFSQRWPSFADAIATDSFGWGLWGSRHRFPSNLSTLSSDEQIDAALRITASWHPHMRKLIRRTDRSTVQHLNIRTSVPLPGWASSNVTLLGDAIHTMTPGRGAGANTALRDAALLSKLLVQACNDGTPLVNAIQAYETEMLRYSTEAVLASRQSMNENDLTHKPLIGDLQLAAMRGTMRLVNALPPVKRMIARNVMRVRGSN
jgi:2-polyprenyl-6-methoxyphenol hydroxylase-like FAD-dependent oxidoreductase